MTGDFNRYPKSPQSSDKPVSMHEDVQVWHDCCCCEAEPYWVEAMAECADEQDAADD